MNRRVLYVRYAVEGKSSMVNSRNMDMRFVTHIHIVGIGGIGMSAIAEVLIAQGYKVTGSDIFDSENTKRLRKVGVDVVFGHSPKNVVGSDVVVVSGAIESENPEVLGASSKNIPVISRGEILHEMMSNNISIAVAGTHGKTTTTGLITNIFQAAGRDPSFVIGGILNETKQNARYGEGRHFIVEADESDGTFLKLRPVIAVLTNIDRDHLSNYQNSFEALVDSFCEFVDKVPFFGAIVLCVDDEVARSLVGKLKRPIITYGFDPGAVYRAKSVVIFENKSQFVVIRPFPHSRLLINLSITGIHNVRNALAAIAVATEEGIGDIDILRGLKKFGGIGRRFEVKKLVVDKKNLILVDDYGHHPSEMKCSIDTVRQVWPQRRLIMVFQPHRYTRNRDLLSEFAAVLGQTDVLILCDVFAAGETPIEGAGSEALAALIQNTDRTETFLVSGPMEAAQVAKSIVGEGDVLMIQGAGDVGSISTRFQENNYA